MDVPLHKDALQIAVSQGSKSAANPDKQQRQVTLMAPTRETHDNAES